MKDFVIKGALFVSEQIISQSNFSQYFNILLLIFLGIFISSSKAITVFIK